MNPYYKTGFLYLFLMQASLLSGQSRNPDSLVVEDSSVNSKDTKQASSISGDSLLLPYDTLGNDSSVFHLQDSIGEVNDSARSVDLLSSDSLAGGMNDSFPAEDSNPVLVLPDIPKQLLNESEGSGINGRIKPPAETPLEEITISGEPADKQLSVDTIQPDNFPDSAGAIHSADSKQVNGSKGALDGSKKIPELSENFSFSKIFWSLLLFVICFFAIRLITKIMNPASAFPVACCGVSEHNKK